VYTRQGPHAPGRVIKVQPIKVLTYN